MRHIVPFSAFFVAGLFFTGCSTSENFINDDVYSVKEAAVPLGTDITDETDYNAYVYNKEKSERNNTYYDEFSRNRNTMRPYYAMRPSVMLGFGSPFMYGMGYNSHFYSPYYSPFYGYYDPFFDPFYRPYGSYYGYGYGYSPYNYYGYGGNGGYYGYGNFYNPYNSSFYSNYTTPSASAGKPSNFFVGKRGSTAGMGGANSRAANALYSPTVSQPVTGKSPSAGTRAAGRPATTTSAKPVASGSVAGRPSASPAVSTGTPAVNRPGRVTGQPNSPARPVQSVGRENLPSRTPATRIESRPASPSISTPARTTTPSNQGGSRPSSGSSGGSVSRPAGKPGR